jgi:hypothetical protein
VLLESVIVKKTITSPTATKPKTVGYGSRSVRDKSTLGRLRWLGELLSRRLKGGDDSNVEPLVTAASVVSANQSLGETFEGS